MISRWKGRKRYDASIPPEALVDFIEARESRQSGADELADGWRLHLDVGEIPQPVEWVSAEELTIDYGDEDQDDDDFEEEEFDDED